MLGLLIIGVVAGVIAGISPCIVPVLPVILVAGATDDGPQKGFARLRRPLAVIAGLIVSFSVVTLAGSALLSALGLPQDLLTDLGIAVLIILGLSLVVPQIGHLLERPFARLAQIQPVKGAGGFVLGLSLGAVFTPCAGPILAAITIFGTSHRFSFSILLLTLAFSVGAAIPLLAVAVAGQSLVARVATLRQRGPLLRQIGGGVMIVMAILIATSALNSLQDDLPGYTTALQNHVEGTAFARQELADLKGTSSASVALTHCPEGDAVLVNCGHAPAFTGITAWLNTPDGRALNWSSLKGHVVLIDFWTYSCINCQRTLPHLEAWYARYHSDGFDIIGVSTPEFAFEHVVSNVRSAAGSLGIHYPVAIDDQAATWNAYSNEYWPAEYLVDAAGVIRHVHFAEGSYGQTETLIRELLKDANPKVLLPNRTDVPDRTPTEETNPETYVGYERLQYQVGANIVPNQATVYHFPSQLPLGGLGFSGTWTDGAQEATAGPDAKLELGVQARDAYLVLGGTGTLTVTENGRQLEVISVSGVPRLYTLIHSDTTVTQGDLILSFTPGVQAYDFTFG